MDCGKGKQSPKAQANTLAMIRKLFFSQDHPTTLGTLPRPVLNQAISGNAYHTFVENIACVLGNILFLTLHVVGTETKLKKDPKTRKSHEKRMRANEAWIQAGVQYAKRKSCRAIVFVTHANLRYYQNPKKRKGFKVIHHAIGEAALAFTKPMLLIQRDKHTLVIDQPPFWPHFHKGAANVTRLQVPGGEHTVAAMLVEVNEGQHAEFSFTLVNAP
ncbi:MAG: hypothetical protein NPIRA02_11790 [Nitrospirales bacterium]|nr:MAG: hypothetical protein NPIRA02_11790 [Nitrospirales bacterium]